MYVYNVCLICVIYIYKCNMYALYMYNIYTLLTSWKILLRFVLFCCAPLVILCTSTDKF